METASPTPSFKRHGNKKAERLAWYTPQMGVDRPTQINLYFYHTPLSNSRSSYNFKFSVVIYSRLGVVEHGAYDSARRFRAGLDSFARLTIARGDNAWKMHHFKIGKSYILNDKIYQTELQMYQA